MGRYPFLQRAARIYRVIAWVELVFGIVGSIIFGMATGYLDALTGALMVIMGILGSVIVWVFLIATADLFRLFIDVEKNTREAAEARK